ncbi:MAG: efflux RND transporter periplasmic adaptor subunit [Pirellulales bacterium]
MFVPRIEKPRFRRSILLVALVLVLAPWAAIGQAQNTGPVPVVVSAVVEQEVAAEQSFVGTVKPLRMSTVGSAVDGRVDEFLVNEGDAVTANQPLARLRTATLELELAAAEAELELRRYELAELENGSRPEEIAQASARMQSAQATMVYSQAKYKRAQSLYNNRSRVITQEDLDLARSGEIEAQQAYEEAKAAYELVLAGPRQERIKQFRAQVDMQQAVVDQIKDRISKHTLVAPFDGFVVAEQSEVGQWIMQGNPVAQIAELSHVEIEVYVPENYIPYSRLGMASRVTLDALPQDAFEGRITRIVPQADPRSRTFPVKVQVENPVHEGSHVFKAGMLARVGLPVGPVHQAMLVHKDALVLGGATPTVLVVDPSGQDGQQGTVRAVPVRPGVAEAGMIQVDGELTTGQHVVVRGNERLRPGQTVQILEVSAQPDPVADATP